MVKYHILIVSDKYLLRKNIFACLFSIHNTISLSRHEQVCLSRLRFERYFSVKVRIFPLNMRDIIIYVARWWEKYLSKCSPLKHTCSWRDKPIVLKHLLIKNIWYFKITFNSITPMLSLKLSFMSCQISCEFEYVYISFDYSSSDDVVHGINCAMFSSTEKQRSIGSFFKKV